MNTGHIITGLLLVILGLMFAFLPIFPEPDSPIAVTRQTGFVIEVDNELMKLACSHHSIGERDIRWDTTNNNFVYIMPDSRIGYIFNSTFLASKELRDYRKDLTDLSNDLDLSQK